MLAAKHTAPAVLAAATVALAVILFGAGAAIGNASKDRVPPSPATNLHETAATTSSVSLAWGAATDDVAVAGYRVYGIGRRASVFGTSYLASRLPCGESFPVSVVAYDQRGNSSTPTTATASTADCGDVQPPTTPARFSQSATTQTSVILAWAASTDNVGVVRYGVYRTSRSGHAIAQPPQPSVTLQGLSCGTTYTYAIDAVDAAGNHSSRATARVTTAGCGDAQAPTSPSDLVVTAHTADSVSVRWSASSDNVAVAGYRVTLDGASALTASTTSATLLGLKCGSSFTVGVTALDAAGNESSTPSIVASTDSCPPTSGPKDTAPPSTPGGLRVSASTHTSLSLAWSASTDDVGVVGYGIYVNGALAATTGTPSVTVPGLACGTGYTLSVDAFDAAGNRSDKATVVGATAACADSSPPTAPANVVVAARTGTSIALSWSAASDDVGVTGYGSYRAGSLVGSTTGTTWIFSGLACGTSYALAVDAYDAAGNRSPKSNLDASTTACSDTSPPSTPTGLAVSKVTQASLTLGWNPAIDNVGVAGYDVFWKGTKMSSQPGTSYDQTGLACGATYSFAVDAFDAAGNVSAQATLTASTSACSSDTSAPSSPTGLATANVSQTGLTLNWNASSDNVGVAGYDVYLDSTKIGTSNPTSYVFGGLSCGTSHVLGVAAYDAAGNVSPRSTVSASTSACAVGTKTYYVDSAAGDDANAGTSSATAWRTLAKANTAQLAPGAQLLFERGGVWAGSLKVGANGTAQAPITIGAYGTGNQPQIGGSGATSCIVLSGSYLVLQDVQASNCTWAGVEIAGSSDLVQRNLISHNVAGVEVKSASVGSAIVDNDIVDNDKMSVLTSSPTNDDSGAFGVLLHGDGTEVAGNRISGSDAFSYDYGRDGAAVEVYGGRNSNVHDNVAVDNHSFTELGNSTSANNTYAYNLVTSSLATADFLVTRGASNGLGPVLHTHLDNNTVYLTGSSSQGFVCYAGCGPDILTMRNNVIQAVSKVGYADAPFDENNDVFYGGALQFTKGSTSVVADPLFVNPSAQDFHLQAQSPAIDRGANETYTQDLDGNPVPVDGNGDGVAAPDAGSYERQGPGSAPPSDTVPPTAPSNLTVGAATATSISASWSASIDNVGVAGYTLYLNGSKVGTATSTSYAFSGLTCGTSYTLGVEAYDAAGNHSSNANATSATTSCAPAGDTSPPTAPSNLSIGVATATSISASWSASTDNVGVAGYTLYLNGSKVGTATSTSYAFSGLTCGTSYTLGVEAYDAAGNASARTNLTTATSPCSDARPPTAPSNLSIGAATATSISASWSASTDNVGVAGYTLYLNGSKVGTATSTSYAFSGLTCGTSYTLGVEAYDAAGNVSARTTSPGATSACQSPSPGPSGPCGGASSPPSSWQHVVWIVMENKGFSQIIGSANAPYINSLASQCSLATNFVAEAHPSLPNYIAMVSGSTQGITDDSGPSSHPLSVPSIFSQLGSGGWRSLEESMPSNCSKSDSGTYAPRHNPAVYFTDVASQCASQDVPLGSTPDISAKFTFITPNLCNDMHSCPSQSDGATETRTGDTWLSTFVPKLLATSEYQAGNTVVVLTWDEDDYSSSNGNHIATIVISPSTPAGAQISTRYDHYSLLRTTEDLLGLPAIGNAASASSMAADFRLR